MKDLIKNLKEDVLKSGLPTEVQVSNLLKRDNWLVINQYPYMDEETIRTLDVQAIKSFKSGQTCNLFIECKKGVDHPWIFYTSTGMSESMGLLYRFVDMVSQRIQRKQNATTAMGPFFSVHPPNMVNSKIGIISYVPFKKKDDFNVARNQLLSAISSRKLIASEKRIIYPVIVFEGDIYEVEVAGEDISFSKAHHINFLSSMISEISFILVDVVTLEYFSSYLDILNKELGPSYSSSEIEDALSKELRALQDSLKDHMT